MLVGQIVVFADLHRHAAAWARIAPTRNDPDEITLSLFLIHCSPSIKAVRTARVTLNKAP